MQKPAVWRLKSGEDRRFRSGHPWVYSNELAESPKGLAPGAPVELRDAGGKFLARGYGNPHSLIAFRTLTRQEADTDPWSQAFILARLQRARDLRALVGLTGVSHRLCFGEADGLPGLVIDHYVLADGPAVHVIQCHTAGADALLPQTLEALRHLDPEAGVVLRNDLGVRKLEGLTVDEPRVLSEVRHSAGAPSGTASLDRAKILVRGLAGRNLTFTTDLLNGQKTGFFLDQAANIRLAWDRIQGLESQSPLRVLDLFCYVGQWSAHFAQGFAASNRRVHATLADASQAALATAKANVQAAGGEATVLQADLLETLPLKEAFDVVICDPPALIKARKDIPQGKHAYGALFGRSLERVRPGGIWVACSCSGLLSEEDFSEVLSKAIRRAGRSVRWIGRGGPAPDHPWLAEFPEGRYLKAWVGVVESAPRAELVSL